MNFRCPLCWTDKPTAWCVPCKRLAVPLPPPDEPTWEERMEMAYIQADCLAARPPIVGDHRKPTPRVSRGKLLGREELSAWQLRELEQRYRYRYRIDCWG